MTGDSGSRGKRYLGECREVLDYWIMEGRGIRAAWIGLREWEWRSGGSGGSGEGVYARWEEHEEHETATAYRIRSTVCVVRYVYICV